MSGAQVTQSGMLDMQVCVPTEWDDEAVKEFADREILAGTTHGWQVARQGHATLAGADERVPCAQREGFVHVRLVC
ncbi:MAG TPA: hypothetical protein VK681_39130 [Reyranella sp.]|nr:hypothetical protein [Reyranella sp.]